MTELRVPEVGEPAPPITHETSAGGTFDLASHEGQWVVVYFYPRANTPG